MNIKKGFTLIELLIVITIVGILTALVTTNLQGARARARDTRRKSDLRAIEQSLRLYYNDYKGFPSSDQNYQIVGCDFNPCTWGSGFSSGSNTYMSSLPQDPSSGSTPITYHYFSGDDNQFLLVANLENLSDSDIADSQARCGDIYGDYAGAETTTNYVVCAQ